MPYTKQKRKQKPRYTINAKRLLLVFSLLLIAVGIALWSILGNAAQAVVVYKEAGSDLDMKIDDTFLILVNWDNPTPLHRPDDLVLLKDVFLEEVALENDNASINKYAGKAASDMFKEATKQGVGKFIIVSAYRSVSYQQQLYAKKLAENPDYAKDPYSLPVSVMPGSKSEHATGLAIDIVNEDYSSLDGSFDQTPEFEWLSKNAHQYGFILRYPQDKTHKTGVIYEPWHYRYVGRAHATQIYHGGLCLEEYIEQLGK